MRKILTRIPRGTYLLISIVLFIFILPVVIDDSHKDIVNASFYSFILLSISSIIGEKKIWALITILCAVSSIWLMYFIDEKTIKYIAFTFSILIFTATVITLISQIIKKKDVDGHLIIETINGYLLIGVIISFINSTILWHNSQAITFPKNIGLIDIDDIVYYSFVSMTTIGFGEIIPQSQIAKSLSIFSGIVGQFYLAIIMALIIGKLLNSKHKN